MATNDHTCRKSWGKRRGYWCCKHDKTSQIDRIWLTTYIDSSIRKYKSYNKVIFCCQNSWYYCRLQYMDRKWQDAAISCMKDPCLIASQEYHTLAEINRHRQRRSLRDLSVSTKKGLFCIQNWQNKHHNRVKRYKSTHPKKKASLFFGAKI